MTRPTGLTPHKSLAVAMAAIAAVAIGLATLRPLPRIVPAQPLLCLPCGELGSVDVILNVILFAPLGAALAFVGLGRRSAVLLMLMFSAAIELLQLGVISGRDATVSDVLSNTIGGVTGLLVASSWRTWLLPRPSAAFRLAGGALAAVLLILGMSAWAFMPSLPMQIQWLQIAPQRHDFAQFEGRVGDVRLSGVSLPSGQLGPFHKYWPALSAPLARLEVEVQPVAPTTAIAPIVRISNPVTEAFLLGQKGADAVFRAHLRASSLRLRAPYVRLHGAFPGAPPDDTAGVIHLWGMRSPGGATVGASGMGFSRQETTRFSSTMGWMLILPFPYVVGSPWDVLSHFWVAMLMLPVGFWGLLARPQAAGRRSGNTLAVLLMIAVAETAGLWAIPRAMGLWTAPFVDWVAASIGAGAGLAAARAAAARLRAPAR